MTASSARSSDAGDVRPEGHEAILARHGLISHVAVLAPETTEAEAAQFQREAARVARNVMPLAPRRFGVLLAPNAGTLSSIGHGLQAVTGAAGKDVRDAAALPAEAPAGTIEPVDARTATGAPFSDAAAPAVHDGETEPRGPSGAAPGEACLAAIEARLDALTPDALAAGLAPMIDEMVARRMEGLAAEVAASLPQAAALPEDRVGAFWDGLEEALRLLHATVQHLDSVTSRPSEGPEAGLRDAIEDLEATVALGFEAAGEAREATLDAVMARLDAAEARTPHDPKPLDRSTLDAALKPVVETLEGLRAAADPIGSAALTDALADLHARLDAAEARADAHEANRNAALDAVRSDLAATSGQLGAIRQALDSRADAERTPPGPVPDQLEAGLSTLTQVAERLEAAIKAWPEASAAPAIQAQDDPRLDQLSATLKGLASDLRDKGGLLSGSVETAHRSMKNFWLAAEDAVGRLDGALVRLASAAEASERVEPGRMGHLESRLDGLAADLAALREDQRPLRQAAAELVAAEARRSNARLAPAAVQGCPETPEESD